MGGRQAALFSPVVPEATACATGGATEVAALGSAIFSAELRLLSWNAAYLELLELPAAFAQVGRSYRDFLRLECARLRIRNDETEPRMAAVLRSLADGQPHRADLHRDDGRHIASIALPLQGGGLTCVCAPADAAASIDAFRISQAPHSTSRGVMDALDAMGDGLAVFDRDDRLLFCNDCFRQYHHTIAERLQPGAQYAWLLQAAFASGQFAAGAQTPELLYDAHMRARQGGLETFEIQLNDGRWLHCSETRTGDGHTISIRSDISQLKHREAELTRLSEALKSQNLHFDTALNNMVQGLCLFDADQRLIVCNKRYLDMYGFSAEVVRPGVALPDIMRYSVSLGNYTAEDAARALAERPVQADMREQSVTEQHLRDGRVIAVLHQPMAGGGSVATYEDITARKRAEQRVRQHTAALESRNRELQNFAYVASHDLQEPLRKIQAFGDRLRARCADTLDADGIAYLDRMQNAAQRMRSLIDDLLSYSRVTTRTAAFEACDLAQIMREVISDLEVPITDKGAQLEIADLPVIDAIPTQMRQLFQNLLSNALKFTRPGVVPVIAVTTGIEHQVVPEMPHEKREVCWMRFSDNGIGFEQKYAEQIFGIFQRLHGRSAYEGTGIGLATVRKILERHRGTIEATGRPGEGAVFLMHLPVKQVEEH